MPDSVQNLVRRAKEGDARACQLLQEMFMDRVLKQCRKYLQQKTEAEDAAQDTFVRAWTRLHQLRVDQAFESWVVRTATNICLNRLKAKAGKEEKEISLDEQGIQTALAAFSSADNPFEEAETAIFVEQIKARIWQVACQHNPPWDKIDLHIFYLRIIHKESYAYIAEKCGISEGTVRFRLRTRILPVLRIVGDTWETK